MPASTPTALVVGGASCTSSCTRIEMCHRFAESRDTVTVDGTASSGNGRDQTMFRG